MVHHSMMDLHTAHAEAMLRPVDARGWSCESYAERVALLELLEAVWGIMVKMEITTIGYWGSIGTTENAMETTKGFGGQVFGDKHNRADGNNSDSSNNSNNNKNGDNSINNSGNSNNSNLLGLFWDNE